MSTITLFNLQSIPVEAVGSNSPAALTSSNLINNAGRRTLGTKLRLCKSILSFSPTCLYKSTNVENAVSRTVAVGSDNNLTMWDINLLRVTDCAPCLNVKRNNY